MRMRQHSSERAFPGNLRSAAMPAAFIVVLLSCAPLWSQPANSARVSLTDSPEPIYSQDRNDSWNRIFYFLFSRHMQVRLSDEFPEGAPFTKEGMDGRVSERSVSTRTFERDEIGDRPIDPFYPSSFDAAAERMVLGDAIYPKFEAALREALNDNARRSPIARVLMQSDLWAAYDRLFKPFLRADETALGERRRTIAELLARMIRKIALAPDEIKSLPNNYAAACRHHALPDLFGKDIGWIEVQWFPERMHDRVAGYRRVSRVFVKPAHQPRDVHAFLAAQPKYSDNPDTEFDGLALVVQILVIDAQGDLKPTALTTDVQIRFFDKAHDGTFKKTSLEVYELSRKLLLQDAGSGGLAVEDESTPAYMDAGHGYEFASSNFLGSGGEVHVGPPVQVRLKTRCGSCHGDNLKRVMTFAIVMPPNPPTVRKLNQGANEQAEFDVGQKKKEKDFEALRKYF